VTRCGESGGAAGEIASLLAPETDEPTFFKPRHSAFYGTPLEFLLRERGISRLILTGLQADICIFYTAQDAYVRRYRLWIPANCVGAQNNAHYRASLSLMRRNLKASTRPAGRSLDLRAVF
jgi:nicotinamidase-related amidase